MYITSDHAGFELKKKILKLLPDLNFVDLNPILQDGDDYPIVANALVEKMSENDIAIAICGSGIGICMALNRHKNIRAAVLYDTQTTILSKSHNHANVVCLSGRLLKPKKAVKLIKLFLKTEASLGERHLRRIAEIS